MLLDVMIPKISGLVGGTDDYITKLFNPLEVVARIRSTLRRYPDNVLLKEL